MRLFCFLSPLLAGCGTMNTARPLSPGEHAVGVTVGGPMVSFAGTYIPLPNLVLEGRSGLTTLADRPLDVNYGLNATGLPFGVVGLHGGASWLALEQQGARPALSLSNRLYLYDNHLDRRKNADPRQLWGMDQLEATVSWAPGRFLVYAGVSEYLDFSSPSLLLSPFLGTEIPIGQRSRLQVQLHHFAINQSKNLNTVTWMTWGPGALGLTLGYQRRLKGD
jgi:hypothetical protein